MDSFGVDAHTQCIMPHMHTTHKCKYHSVHVHTDTHTYTDVYLYTRIYTPHVHVHRYPHLHRYVPIYTNIHTTVYHMHAAAKSLQSCPTLYDPIDGSPSGSPVPGILQARTLGWVAIFFSNAWKWKVKVKSLSRVRLLATPWTAAYHAPPSMGFSRQEHWSGVPLPSPIICILSVKSYAYTQIPTLTQIYASIHKYTHPHVHVHTDTYTYTKIYIYS